MWTPEALSLFMINHPYLDSLNDVEIYNALKNYSSLQSMIQSNNAIVKKFKAFSNNFPCYFLHSPITQWKNIYNKTPINR